MVSVAGAAFGASASVALIDRADNIASALVRTASGLRDRWTGRAYSSLQKEHLSHYRRLCEAYCKSASHLEFFEFDEDAQRPVKSKDEMFEQSPSFENCDSPFNLCRERRALIRHIHRLCKHQLRSQESLHVCLPTAYVAAELRKWSKCIPIDPSGDLSIMLEARVKYLMEVHRYALKFREDLEIVDVLEAMGQLLSSCRERVKYHELRQLLPRIHGETNAICEIMAIALPPLMSIAKLSSSLVDSRCPHEDLRHRMCSQSSTSALLSFDEPALAIPGPEVRDSIADVYHLLFRTLQEVQDVNKRILEQFLMCSDGLPITSVSRVCPSVVRSLQECLTVLCAKVSLIEKQLKVLTAKCHALYSVDKKSAASREWKSKYDDVREDIADIHSAINRCLKCMSDVESFLHDHTDLAPRKRKALPLSPDCPSKFLRLEPIRIMEASATED